MRQLHVHLRMNQAETNGDRVNIEQTFSNREHFLGELKEFAVMTNFEFERIKIDNRRVL